VFKSNTHTLIRMRIEREGEKLTEISTTHMRMFPLNILYIVLYLCAAEILIYSITLFTTVIVCCIKTACGDIYNHLLCTYVYISIVRECINITTDH
jgi:hypothetical protein